MTNCKISGCIMDERQLRYNGKEFTALEIGFTVEGWMDKYGEEIEDLDYDTMTIIDFVFPDDQWQDTKEWDTTKVEFVQDEDFDKFLNFTDIETWDDTDYDLLRKEYNL